MVQKKTLKMAVLGSQNEFRAQISSGNVSRPVFSFLLTRNITLRPQPTPQIRSIYTYSWRTNVSITDFQIKFQIFLLYSGNMGRGSSKITNTEPRFHWKVISTIISFKQVEKSPLELADNLLEEIFRFRG